MARVGRSAEPRLICVDRSLRIPSPGSRPLRLLAIGCHSDDIEIGCGGAILTLLATQAVDVTWVVLGGAEPTRAEEARAAARAFLRGSKSQEIVISEFRDSFMPHDASRVKEFFETLAKEAAPDLIFTHQRADLHQDHRLAGELTWQTFRSHTILEYEIPKWDGDLGTPNVYVPLGKDVARRKLELLLEHFGSQQEKDWYGADVFMSLMRLRAMECRAPDGAAEAFYGRKLTLDLS